VKLWLESLEHRDMPTGTIAGIVFEDFNSNGVFDTSLTIPNASLGSVGVAIDRGIGGVTVTAYDSAGVVRGTAVSAPNGTYSLNATGSGPYRIQFTTLPAGFFSGPHGPNSGTTVQFVPDGPSSDVSLGLVRPQDYSQNNPDLVTNCYVFGDQVNGDNQNEPVIVSFPYSAGSEDSDLNSDDFLNPAAHALAIPARQVGTTWGLGYDQPTRTIYAGAFMKRHSGFGPNGTGAIYQMPTTGTSATLFADLNAIFGPGTAGTDPHDPNDYNADNFNATWNAVGKDSLGGLDVSQDGQTVYVMNLADRQLYALPTSGPLNMSTVRRVSIPVAPGATGITADNPLGDLRPFAVQVYRGNVYVGIVNSAETTQNRSDLKAYVYQVTDNGSNLTFGSAPAFQMNLDYPRGFVYLDSSAQWLPWAPGYANISNTPDFNVVYPQPMLTGIAFDTDGNMVLGLRDRVGDQTGYLTQEDPVNQSLVFGMTGGDTLRAFINTPGNLASGWTEENDGRGPHGEGTGPQNTGQGPGGAKFYFQSDWAGGAANGGHDDVTLGGLVQVPGFPDVVTSVYNPDRLNGNGHDFRAGGIRWFNNAAGNNDKSYQLYSDNTIFVGKAGGIGDLIAIVNPAPIEIGNRVWRDPNGNGIQDANEPGIPGVTVHLYAPDGVTVLATAITDAQGDYYFSSTNIPGFNVNTAGYTVRLDNPADYAPGGRLFSYSLTVANAGTDQTINSKGIIVNGFPRAVVNTGRPGQNDHTFDFGFRPQQADLVVMKTVDNATPIFGTQITYTITVSNHGPDTATNVIVFDPLPAGLVLIAAVPSQGSVNTASGVWTVGTLAYGASAFLHVTAQTAAVGPIVNHAEARADQFDPNLPNSQATLSVTVRLSPEQISKADLLASAMQGSNAVRGPSLVQVRRENDGALITEFAPYGPAYTGPISVAVGDVNGDGVPDLVTGAGVGNPDVRVFDGRAFKNGTFDPANPAASLLAQWFAYGINFNVGANVAVGDIEHDGFADIVTGATVGNPHVKVYSGRDIALHTFDPNGSSVLAQWFAYGLQFNIGANVAVGDVSRNGYADVITGATAGNPHVKVYSGRDIALHTFDPNGSSVLAQWFAYGLQFNIGANVAVANTSGSGYADVITGATAGNPHVKVYSGQDIANGSFQPANPDASLLNDFYAYNSLNANVGVTLAAADFEGTGKFDILTGPTRGPANFRVVKGTANGVMPPAVNGIDFVAPDLTDQVFIDAWS
jgi:uncharacterized repeat protein (TIGR01451 family)